MMSSFSEVMSGLRVPAQFFFVRHGESEGNVVGMMQGQEDVPLTDRGRDQAKNTSEWFLEQKVEIDRVFTSPLSRASETASILSDTNKYPAPTATNDLQELSMGIFSGLTISEIKTRFPEAYTRFSVGSWEAVDGAETVLSLTARALGVWKLLVDTANGGNPRVLSVSHGGMTQWILKSSFGAALDSTTTWMPLIKASNCSVFLFTARPAGPDWYYGQWSLVNFVPGSAPDLGDQFYTSAR